MTNSSQVQFAGVRKACFGNLPQAIGGQVTTFGHGYGSSSPGT
jgi:hypothetical protein